MKELLKKLSEKFDEEADKIKEFVTNNANYTSDFFDSLPTFTSLENRPRKMWGKKGVYIFLITKPVSLDYVASFLLARCFFIRKRNNR